MKLGHFIKNNERFIGYKSEDGIINVNEAAKQKGLPLPESIDTLIRSGEQGREQLHHVLEAISDPSLYLVKEQDITFDSVVINPEKFYVSA